MDADQFDRLSRALSHGLTRRTLTSLVAVLTLGRSLGSQLEVAQAKKGGGKKGGGKKNGGGGKRNKNDKKNDKKDNLPHCGGGTFRCPTFDGAGTDCVNLLEDVHNCGECNKQCGREGPIYKNCIQGECVPCPAETPNICTNPGGSTLYRCVSLDHVDTCGGCTPAHVCKKDPGNPQRDFQCINRQCVCPGQTCQDGSCCPSGYECVGAGPGCCPTGYYACGNGRCCPNGFRCGGTCGQECCA